MIITPNDLKNGGISLVEKLMEKSREVFISVKGQKKFVILPVEEYERLRKAELETIIREAEKDYQEGRYVVESAEEHFRRLGI
ncbi:MAG: prevent-host-death protein [Thermodesulfatator sp.]|nr:MAG: prevent-host-death protein [Thermodesulfatator sp.]